MPRTKVGNRGSGHCSFQPAGNHLLTPIRDALSRISSQRGLDSTSTPGSRPTRADVQYNRGRRMQEKCLGQIRSGLHPATLSTAFWSTTDIDATFSDTSSIRQSPNASFKAFRIRGISKSNPLFAPCTPEPLALRPDRF